MCSVWSMDWSCLCALGVYLCIRVSIAVVFPVCIDISVCMRSTSCVVTCEPVTNGHGPLPRPLLRERTAASFSSGLSSLCCLLFW